jgi:hypothetical protein
MLDTCGLFDLFDGAVDVEDLREGLRSGTEDERGSRRLQAREVDEIMIVAVGDKELQQVVLVSPRTLDEEDALRDLGGEPGAPQFQDIRALGTERGAQEDEQDKPDGRRDYSGLVDSSHNESLLARSRGLGYSTANIWDFSHRIKPYISGTYISGTDHETCCK